MGQGLEDSDFSTDSYFRVAQFEWYTQYLWKWREFFSLDLKPWIGWNLSNDIGKDSHQDWKSIFGLHFGKFSSAAIMFLKGPNPGLVWIFSGRFMRQQRSFCVKLKEGNSAYHKSEALIGWQFPSVDWNKLNVDGSCYGEGENIACGGLIRDASGSWIRGFLHKIGAGSVLQADLWGILTGLKMAWNAGMEKVIVEADSKCEVELCIKECHISNSLLLNYENKIFDWGIGISVSSTVTEKAIMLLIDWRIWLSLWKLVSTFWSSRHMRF